MFRLWAIASFSAVESVLTSTQSFGTVKVRPVLAPVTSWLSPGAGFADASSWLDGVLPAEVSLSSSSFSSVSLVAEAEVLPEAAEVEVSEPRVS